MDTLLVRLKAYEPRRGYVLKTYTYGGIKFQPDRGWYRVSAAVGEYLRSVHEIPRDPHSPLAFDVATDDEARAIEAAEKKEAAGRQNATDDLKLSPARGEAGALTTADLAGDKAPAARAGTGGGTQAPAAPPAAAAPATAPSSGTPAATAPGAAAGAVFPSVEPPDGGGPKGRKGGGS